MTGIVYLFERIAPAIYFFCAAALIWNLRIWLRSRRALSRAEFELERELAEADQAAAITRCVATIEIALAAVAIALVIAPTIRADLLATGSTIGGEPSNPAAENFITVTPGGDGSDVANLMLTITAQALSEAGGPLVLLTPEASPTPVGTILAGYPTPVDCNVRDQAWLEIPAPGQQIFDSITVVGVANVPNFAFYKFELAGPSTGGGFAPILGDKTSPVPQKGVLGQMPLSPFQPGNYDFRLAVFDNTGLLKASCTVRVLITTRPGTATPLPTPIGGQPGS